MPKTIVLLTQVQLIVYLGLNSLPYFLFQWTDEIVAHLAEHGVTTDDFESLVSSTRRVVRSRSSDRWLAFGYCDDGRYLVCIFELLDDDFTVIPVTAYEPTEE